MADTVTGVVDGSGWTRGDIWAGMVAPPVEAEEKEGCRSEVCSSDEMSFRVG